MITLERQLSFSRSSCYTDLPSVHCSRIAPKLHHMILLMRQNDEITEHVVSGDDNTKGTETLEQTKLHTSPFPL